MLGMELFDHLTVSEQMTDVLIELLVIYSNTWNHMLNKKIQTINNK